MIKRGACFLAGILLLSAPSASADAVPQTVEQQLAGFLDYPFATGLVAAKNGERLAWVEARRGVRNIWIADAGGGAPRQLTFRTQDDGQDVGQLTWSDDGRILAWCRGCVERNGWASAAPANPASFLEAPRSEIWASVTGGVPVMVGEGEQPSLSSLGQLAWLKDGQVWTGDPRGGSAPTPLFRDRGKVDSLSWSPDGKRLAFVSHRAGYSFVGVYAPSRPALLWIAPSTENDFAPTWSPDGERVAFARRGAIEDPLAADPQEKPRPFSLWVGSATDGTARRVWASPATLPGSYPQLPDGLFLMWAKGDRLTFRAELDGWPHLYSLPVSGGVPMLLTPGKFMVEHVAMTADRAGLLFDANRGSDAADIDRRHVFRVPVDQPVVEALSSGAGLEWTPVPLKEGIAYLGATVASPPAPVLASLDGRSSRAIGAPTAYRLPRSVTPKAVTFTADDGQVVHGQLFEAKGDGHRRPGLVFLHGGPRRQMLVGWSSIEVYSFFYALNQYLATHGYSVLSVNYRLGIGYGRDFQHAAHAGSAGNAEYQDVLAGARYLQSRPSVDPERIGIFGGSYGGYLTAQALARDSGLFKAGVDFYGVHDWSAYGAPTPPSGWDQGGFADKRKLAYDSSPVAAIKGWTSPVLLIHGDDDRHVPFSQTVDLARRLDAQGTPVEVMVLPNEVHGFLRYDNVLSTDAATVTFFDQKLGRR